ncbi:hypothetical protein KSS87_004842 [Heliosperma pusillum]|nr:hypothetical protein KSS87_004842 [Heliosperma pusillum]
MAVVTIEKSIWANVIDITKNAQEKGSDPGIWAMQISMMMNSSSAAVVSSSEPSIELAHVLVSHICWDNNLPITWKFLEFALTFNLVPPFLVLALLSTKVLPCRKSRPAGYRLYMELLKIYALKLKSHSHIHQPNFQKVMTSIDHVLGLSQIFGSQVIEPEVLLVKFIFTIVWQLLDALLDDEGFLDLTPEKKSIWTTSSKGMVVDTLWTSTRRSLNFLRG